MIWFREAARKIITVIFPWPGRHERAMTIAAARRERERSEVEARNAEILKHRLHKMAAENHFADMIADQIIRGRG